MYSQKIRMEMAVGEQFEAFGILLCDWLTQVGHGTDEYLIDVGCSSGRLTKPRSQYLSGRYLGIDVALEHVAYASNLIKRPDWRFEIPAGVTILERNPQADMECFSQCYPSPTRAILRIPQGSITSTKTFWRN
jgi:hypothetical protein